MDLSLFHCERILSVISSKRWRWSSEHLSFDFLTFSDLSFLFLRSLYLPLSHVKLKCAYLVTRGLFSYPPTIMTLLHTPGLVPIQFFTTHTHTHHYYHLKRSKTSKNTLFPTEWPVLNFTCLATLNAHTHTTYGSCIWQQLIQLENLV